MAATELIGQHGSNVDGRWVEGDKVVAVENPADETTVCELSVTPLDEIRRAISSAPSFLRRGTWAGLTARIQAERARPRARHRRHP